MKKAQSLSAELVGCASCNTRMRKEDMYRAGNGKLYCDACKYFAKCCWGKYKKSQN
jgi:hypothetical protein